MTNLRKLPAYTFVTVSLHTTSSPKPHTITVLLRLAECGQSKSTFCASKYILLTHHNDMRCSLGTLGVQAQREGDGREAYFESRAVPSSNLGRMAAKRAGYCPFAFCLPSNV
jgi:hypothetical protein